MAALFAVGGALRFAGLGLRGIWFDEAYTAALARLSFGSICEALRYDSGPPLLYFVVKVFPRTELGEFWLRLPGATFSTLALPLVLLVGRRVGGTGVGLFALFLTAISPLQIHYAQEARFYPFLAFFALLACVGLFEMIDRRSHTGLGLYLASALILIYLHNVGLVFVFACMVTAGWRIRGRDLRIYFLLGHLVLGLVYLAWVPVLLEQMRASTLVINWMERFWKGYPPALALFRTFEAYSFAPRTPGFVGLTYWPQFAPLCAVLWLVLIGIGFTNQRVRTRRFLDIMVIVFLFLLILFVYSFIQPVYLAGRSDSFLFPLVAVGIAAGLDRVRTWWRGTAVVAPIAFALLSTATLIGAHYVSKGEKDREAALWLASRCEPSDFIILCGRTAVTLDYYLRRDVPDVECRYFPLRLEREFSTTNIIATPREVERLRREILFLQGQAESVSGETGSVWISGTEGSVRDFLLGFFVEHGWDETGSAFRFRTAKTNLQAVILELRRKTVQNSSPET